MTDSIETPEGGSRQVVPLRGVDTPAALEEAFQGIDTALAAMVEARVQRLREEHYAHLREAEEQGAEGIKPDEADVTPVALALIEDAQRFKYVGEKIAKGAQLALDAVGEEIEAAELSVKGRSGHRFTEPGTGTVLFVGTAGQENSVWDLDPILQAVAEEVTSKAIQAGVAGENGGIDADEVDAYRKGAYRALVALKDYAKIEPKVNPVKALAKDLRKRSLVSMAVAVEKARTIVWQPRSAGGFSLTRDTRTSR